MVETAAIAGAIAGLGALAKTSVLPMVGVLGVVTLWSVWRRTKDTPRGRRALWIAAAAGVYLTVAALVGGWWYLRNALRWGDPLGLSSHTQTLWGRPEPATLVQLLPEIPLLARSFWGAYGWGHVTWPTGVYAVLWGVTLPLLVLAVAHLWRSWGQSVKSHSALRPRTDADLATLSGTLSLLWLLGIAAALVRWMQQVEAPHGRLLFPALGAWALLVGLGLRQLVERRARIGRVIVRALPAGCAVLATLAPGARIAATFAPPRLESPAKVSTACTAPADLRYDGLAQLLCAEVSPDRVAPGGQVSVTVCWTPLAPMDRDYTVFVHLIGPQESRVMERHTYPGLGKYPTSAWVPGEAFCDTYTGEVAGWAAAPIRYRVEVGLFDAETGNRLIAHAADGHPLDPPVVGEISVVSRQNEPSDLAQPPPASFDDGITLTGSQMPGAAQPGSEVDVTLNWAATSTPTQDYVAFVHLWQPGDPSPLAQEDSQPRAGWYPTSVWRAGDLIPDVHTLRLPADLPPGVYPLWAGLYRPDDGTRLAAFGPDGRLPDDLVPLGTLRIEPK